ncbi:MAG: sortase [Chloroflexota bacterium]|jgi:sortase A|nr:sortase [Chloroflexota bacterium]
MFGCAFSLFIYVASNVGYQVTTQNQLTSTWDRTHVVVSGTTTVQDQRRPRLRAGEPLARISVPSIGFNGVVLEGTDDRTLSGGPGHLIGSAYPGEPDNVVISNHNTYSQQWGDLKVDQVIQLDADYGRYVYKVTGFKIIDANDKSVTASTGHGALTFTTCYPLWAGALARQRYVVQADLQ